MKTICSALAAWLCLLMFSPPAFSQLASTDVELSSAIAAAQQQYAASFSGPSQLINGPEYLDYSKRYHARTGHQFFDSSEQQPGSVYYNGHDFKNLRLVYDVVLDQVILSQPTSPLMLRLINENVRYFTSNKHRFVRLVADSASSKVIRTGFYEVLLDSTVQVLAKRAKRMQERTEQQNVNVEFTATDRIFIKKAGRYYLVSSKSSVVRLFADRSKEMQPYIQAHKLKFNKMQREASIVQLAGYYCSLPAR